MQPLATQSETFRIPHALQKKPLGRHIEIYPGAVLRLQNIRESGGT